MPITSVNKRPKTAEDEWEETWRPFLNPWEAKAEQETFFSDWGEQRDFVEAFNRRQVWTLLETGHCGLSIVSGFHVRNARGYYITKKERPKPKRNEPEQVIEVVILPAVCTYLC